MNKFKIFSNTDGIKLLYTSNIVDKYSSDDMLITSHNREEDGCYLFCYGSNSITQLKKRVNNNNLTSTKAYLPGHSLIFAGRSNKWNGGVASIIKVDTIDNADVLVKGSIVYLRESEFIKLDKFEGSTKNKNPFSKINNLYRRKYITVKDKNDNDVLCISYIKNNLTWISYPSNDYLQAITNNLKQHWNEPKIFFNNIYILDGELNVKGHYVPN